MKSFLLFTILTISAFGINNNKNFFIENKGQWPTNIQYLTMTDGINAWITNSGVVYDYFRVTQNKVISGHVVKMELVDANTSPANQGNTKQPGYYNYFTGNDKTCWTSFVNLYGDISLNNIYEGIDIKYYYDSGLIRYDYVIKPGADISKIKLKFTGQESLSINDNGELILKTSIGEITNGKLFSYQTVNRTKTEVRCAFTKHSDGTIGFTADGYDNRRELIIDPLIYSTYVGGRVIDESRSIAIDDSGNTYITGNTSSSGYPLSTGAYQKTYGGLVDAFVTKINPSGSTLVYSTFLGGVSNDYGYSISVDKSLNTYISGYTNSSDFPITNGAYQTTFAGGTWDAFVVKLNPSGSSLIYSTYLGGSADDNSYSLAVDNTGNAFITGITASANFPVTSGSYQTNLAGNSDIFVTKLNPQGTGLVYSTYIGSANYEIAYGICIDNNDNAYIAGYTTSPFYPITPGAVQVNFGGSSDALFTKLNPTGDSLFYSTLLGGSSDDFAKSIDVDNSGNVYISGNTFSANFPVTSGAYQTSFGGIFVTKINPNTGSMIYSTMLGSSSQDVGNAIKVDKSGNAYITGSTLTSSFPVTSGACQKTIGGSNDAFITELNPSGNSLVYSSFLGGTNYESAFSLAIDTSGNTYISGSTNSTDYPVSTVAFQKKLGGGVWDAFVACINIPQITSSYREADNSIPGNYSLEQNYPNPFNPVTTINYSIPKPGHVVLNIYNSIGSKLAVLINEYKLSGNYSVRFNGSNLPSGIYLYRLDSENYSAAKKFVLLK